MASNPKQRDAAAVQVSKQMDTSVAEQGDEGGDHQATQQCDNRQLCPSGFHHRGFSVSAMLCVPWWIRRHNRLRHLNRNRMRRWSGYE